MNAAPMILSKKEVLMKLWEAREHLEAEALKGAPVQEVTVDQGSKQAVTQHEEIREAVTKDVKEKAATLETPARPAERPATNLMSPEVTEGLERLLSEWPYFKGSGMLGFGPGGIKHPTYLKIAKLPVRHVLTGRFDDPDQDLINEVREYVGGWRREQGVEPDETETFEMYLRRVIATILDKRAAIDARTA